MKIICDSLQNIIRIILTITEFTKHDLTSINSITLYNNYIYIYTNFAFEERAIRTIMLFLFLFYLISSNDKDRMMQLDSVDSFLKCIMKYEYIVFLILIFSFANYIFLILTRIAITEMMF